MFGRLPRKTNVEHKNRLIRLGFNTPQLVGVKRISRLAGMRKASFIRKIEIVRTPVDLILETWSYGPYLKKHYKTLK